MTSSPHRSPETNKSNKHTVSKRSTPTEIQGSTWLSFKSLFSPLRIRDYRLLFGGQLVSTIGDQFYGIALPWLLLSSGGGAASLGLVLTVYGVLRVSCILVGGPLSDRLGPRRVMLLSDTLRALVVGFLAILVVGGGHPAPLILCIISALDGAFSGLFTPAAWSIAPFLLPKEDLQAGNALQTSARDGSGLVGSSIAGLVVSLFQPAVAFALDALSFVVSAVTLAAMRERQSIPSAKQDDRMVEKQGDSSSTETSITETEKAWTNMTFWQFLHTSRYLQIMLMITTCMNLGSGAAFGIALPVFVHDGLQAGATGYGFILAAFAIGALLGALGAGGLGTIPHRCSIGLSFFIVQACMIALIPFFNSVVPVCICMLSAGLMNGLGNVTTVTLMQHVLPRSLLGRIMSALAVTNFGFFPLSVALGGFLVAHYGSLFIFLLNAILIALPAAWGLCQPECWKL